MNAVDPFRYESGTVPPQYRCGRCDVHGVRLYRQYQTMLNQLVLLCRSCAISDQRVQPAGKEHVIGWLVSAVPTENGYTYWGFSSVPSEGVKWWEALPKERTDEPRG